MPGWVDLHVHSNYSFLDGASDVDDLADAAVEQGLDALALTDTNGLYGAVRFANAAKERGLRPIFGAELQLQDMGHIVLIARDRQGWTSLCRTNGWAVSDLTSSCFRESSSENLITWISSSASSPDKPMARSSETTKASTRLLRWRRVKN